MNAEKFKLYLAKNNSDKKKKYDSLRKRIWQAKLKESPHQYEQYKVNERFRKLKKTSNTTTSNNSEMVMESQSMEDRHGSSTGQNDTPPSISPSSCSNKQRCTIACHAQTISYLKVHIKRQQLWRNQRKNLKLNSITKRAPVVDLVRI